MHPKKKFIPPAPRRKGNRMEWTKEQDAIVRKNYTKHGSVYTARLLGRSKDSVQHRALRLGVPGHGIRPWTRKEIAYLRLQYPKLTAIKIARVLKRTEQSVRAKIHGLGLGGDPSRPWTSAEINYLRKYYGTVTAAELGRELGRTRNGVEIKAGRIGLGKSPAKFTKADERYVIAHLGKEPFTVMARKLGTSIHHVEKTARKHGYRSRPTSRPWTDADDRALRAIYEIMSRRDVAARMERTELAVVVRARSLGLKSTYREKRTGIKRTQWTPREDARLRKLYAAYSRTEVAAKLGRSSASVEGRIRKLGLVKAQPKSGRRS